MLDIISLLYILPFPISARKLSCLLPEIKRWHLSLSTSYSYFQTNTQPIQNEKLNVSKSHQG